MANRMQLAKVLKDSGEILSTKMLGEKFYLIWDCYTEGWTHNILIKIVSSLQSSTMTSEGVPLPISLVPDMMITKSWAKSIQWLIPQRQIGMPHQNVRICWQHETWLWRSTGGILAGWNLADQLGRLWSFPPNLFTGFEVLPSLHLWYSFCLPLHLYVYVYMCIYDVNYL